MKSPLCSTQLLFEIRQLKKAERVFKFYSDEVGSIAVKGKQGDINKRITDIAVESSGKLKTRTVDETLDDFSVSVPLDLFRSGGEGGRNHLPSNFRALYGCL